MDNKLISLYSSSFFAITENCIIKKEHIGRVWTKSRDIVGFGMYVGPKRFEGVLERLVS